MRAAGFGLLILLGFLWGPASVYAGCPCPKAKMVELYGSVSMFPPKLPGPRVHQPAARLAPLPVTMTALSSMADVARSMPTPVLDRMANPLLWDPVFIRQ